MFFKKIKFDFHINNYQIQKYVSSYRLNSDSEVFKGIIYHTLNNNDHLFDILPKWITKFFQLNHLKINCKVRPHIDHGINTSINFYIKTSNCKTTFYSFIDQTIPRTIPLDANNLKEEDSFVAKNREVFILDVSCPHSVEPLDNNFSERTVFCLQTHLNYKTVLNFLNLQKN